VRLVVRMVTGVSSMPRQRALQRFIVSKIGPQTGTSPEPCGAVSGAGLDDIESRTRLTLAKFAFACRVVTQPCPLRKKT
jgi:hypothetical protein